MKTKNTHGNPMAWLGRVLLLSGAIVLLSETVVRAADSVPNYVPGHVLLQIQPGEDVRSIEDDYHATLDAQDSDSLISVLDTPNGVDEAAFVSELQADPRVRHAEVDSYLTLPDIGGHHFHFAFDAGPQPGAYTNQNAYRQVGWSGGRRGRAGLGVIVAVLDTGVALSHPALKGRLIPGYNALQPGTDPLDGADTFPHPALGHGTMVTGLIARLAPGARLMPVRVLNSAGEGTLLTVLRGLDFAVRHGAKVINMSFGTTDASPALTEALAAAADSGIILVASAGNEGANERDYPAADPNVLAVASVEANNIKSVYSDFGPHIAVVAPGSGIRSTYWDGGYANWSGTSFSAPFVTAEAALVCAALPGLEADQVSEHIRGTARGIDRFNPGYRRLLGGGLITIDAALLPNSEDN